MSLVITILLLGLLAGLSPATIVVFLLLLATTRAKVNAAAFLIGWCVSLVVVFSISYAVGGTHTAEQGGGRTAVEIVEIGLGLGLIFLASQQWRHRNRPRTPSGVTRTLQLGCKSSTRGKPQSSESSNNRGRSLRQPPWS